MATSDIVSSADDRTARPSEPDPPPPHGGSGTRRGTRRGSALAGSEARWAGGDRGYRATTAAAAAGDPELARLVELYDRRTPPEALGAPAPDRLLDRVRQHRGLAARRVSGRSLVRLRDDRTPHPGAAPHDRAEARRAPDDGAEARPAPDDGADARPAPDDGDVGRARPADRMATVIEVVTDDMPFLVDSMLSALGRAGLAARLVLHPIMVVRRALTGELAGVVAGGSSPVGAGSTGPAAPETDDPVESLRESWMHIELDGVIGDAETRRALVDELRQVLSDVRDVVEDTDRMRRVAHEIAESLRKEPPPLDPAVVAEGARLVDWLADGHATFLGYRRYELHTGRGRPELTAVLASGLGVLRGDTLATQFFAPDTPAGDRAVGQDLMLVSLASSPSRVSRAAYPHYVSVKTFDDQGNVTGEHRFLGLLTVAALYENVLDIPVVERRVRSAIARAGLPMESYSGQRMLEVISAYPREELFRASAEELHDTAVGVLSLTGRRAVRLFLRRDPYHRFYSCLVYLPRDRYTTTSRLAMQDVLCRELHGRHVEYSARVTESSLALLHVTVHTDPDSGDPPPPAAQLQDRLADAVRTWDDHVLELAVQRPELADMAHRYLPLVPAAYKAAFTPSVAVADLCRLDGLADEPEMELYAPADAPPGERRFKLFLAGEEVTLTALLPVLQQMGVEVVEERPYQIVRPDGRSCWVYDFGLRIDEAALAETRQRGEADVESRFCEAFAAAWRGDCETDPYNALVIRAGLTWRQVALLRAYARYQRQIGSPYSHVYLAEILLGHSSVTKALVELFETRFSPELGTDPDAPERVAASERQLAGLTTMIDDVTGLDADRVLRGYLNLITSTVRTNYFTDLTHLALKLDPTQIRDLPRPAPHAEIFVYSPRVEGVHLRFGPVARGGLRWSDRPADFRTEVLGLVKAQAVKNAVIVPVGAKGGFVVKRPPAATGDPAVDRDATQTEGIACYRIFISGLLDLTDNLVDGAVIPPRRVVRHDGDDSYLVVAADKGTATFSDIANGLARDRGFWLGDAFASGGTAGYDHKAMGITARGAWESVKRHFRELGVDTQAQGFTVVGIGDMSGDVFGNGMLLSAHIRLVAAFDHRHVFVDPDPDPDRSFTQRRRLFELPRSSWDDYDRAAISEGGGVWSRTSKSIPVSEQMRSALGLDGSLVKLTPPELIRAILLAPADLLWNGGVGTYVKAAAESNGDVGDKANDAIRVDGGQLRVKVVGEGGNLGLTQRGRIEFARAGGKVNTDALDNSAGVDCSDHEVNIKVPLGRLVASGALDQRERDHLLRAMTDEVAALVLADNVSQNAMLGVARSHTAAMTAVHARLVADLEARAHLDRTLDVLPDVAGFTALTRAGQGLTSPELATLMAHVKLRLKAEILRSELPDAPVFASRLPEYFPAPLRERYPDAVAAHPLSREIVTTLLVNEMVDGGGITFAYRLAEELSAEATDALRAYAVTTSVFGLPELWREIDALTGAAGAVADELVLESRRLLDRAARWFLTNRPQPLAVGAEINRFAAPVAALRGQVPAMLAEQESALLTERTDTLLGQGVPVELAGRIAAQLSTFGLLDVVEVTELAERYRPGTEEAEVAELYFALSEHLGIDKALTSVSALERGNRWHSLARQALRDDFYGSLRSITLDALRDSLPGDPLTTKIGHWERVNASKLGRARSALQAVEQAGQLDLATLSVVSRQLRGLAR